MQARILADPERVAARLAKSIQGRDTPEHRELLRQRMLRQQRSRKFRSAMADAGRRVIAANGGSEAARAKAVAGMKRTKARVLAERYGFPLTLVDEFRAFRSSRLSAAEIVAVLRASYPAAFVEIDAEAVRAARRSAGPMPAPGTDKRRAWDRAVGEARPCV